MYTVRKTAGEKAVEEHEKIVVVHA